MPSFADLFRRVEAGGDLETLAEFRRGLHACLQARADELFELTEALLCAPGPVRQLVDLALAVEHRRGHGALYDGINAGRIEVARLSTLLANLPVPRTGDGRIVLAVDVSNWLRPDAVTSPDRAFCHVRNRGGGSALTIPGWPYSVVAALESGRTCWTAVLDAVRITPADEVAEVTATQLRRVVQRLIEAGHWSHGDAPITICLDAGYDIPHLAYRLADLPVLLVGRLRSDRVFRFPAASVGPRGGRPAIHGPAFALADASTHPTPAVTTTSDTPRCGTATATCWDRLHPQLTHRNRWADHDGPLPVIEGTIIRLQVDHLPGNRHPAPMWLWTAITGADPAQLDRLWQAYLRRFDIEHTFRLFKQTLGWTAPKIRSPQAADRWTWLVIAAHTQLRLARPLVADLRHPWEKPAAPGRLTPARVRRGFRNLRPILPLPASAPKP
uniref:NF041680 family putative transposase n=2 Tax=Catenulispora pinisilvae TaxID=2705253 RepID=UPI00189217E3